MEQESNQQQRGIPRTPGRAERTHNALRHDDDVGWSRPAQPWNQRASRRRNPLGSFEDLRPTSSDWNPIGWGTGARFLRYDHDDDRDEADIPYDERSYSQYSAGHYYGRGPKGYQRSDDRIRDDVCDCLTRDPRVDASEIEVAVKDGDVILTGTIGDRRQKRAAEDAIEDVLGVKDIHNRIRILNNRSAMHG